MAVLDWVCSVAPPPVARGLLARFRSAEFAHLDALRSSSDPDGYGLAPFARHEAIFVHVPKAAGVSLCRALFGGLGGGHTTLAEYRLLFDPSEFRRFFKFAFVRNPWDRLHSAYHFLASGGMNDDDARWAKEHLARYDGFGDFVRRFVAGPGVESKVHFVPQHRFLVLPGRARPGVDFVGRFENLAADYDTVRARIHGEGGEPLPHENRTAEAKGDFRDAYDDETRAIVARVYRRDIELFGYAFE